MVRPRLRAAALVGAAVTAVTASATGCSSSGLPHRTVPAGPTSSGSTSSGPAVLSATLPHTAAALATAMRHGLAVTTSAHLTVRAPGHSAVTGSMTLAGGTPTSLSLSSGSGRTAVHLVVVNSVAYARTGARTTWSPVPVTGRLRPVLRRTRALLALVRTTADPAALLTALHGARVQLLGRGTVGTVPAAHYRLRSAAAAAQRIDLWVDGGSRPLVVERQGQGTVRFGRYGAAVHITAPAPSDISR